MEDVDYVALHAPYNKLTQKGFARLYYDTHRLALASGSPSPYPSLAAFDLPLDASYADVGLEKAVLALSRDAYTTKVAPSTLLPQQLGNMYTASLYAGLLSLLTSDAPLVGKRLLCFSYGSGLASSMFSMHAPERVAASPLTAELSGRKGGEGGEVETAAVLVALKERVGLQARLQARVQRTPAEFEAMMEKREKLHALSQFTPSDPIDDLAEGTWYLVEKDAASRRQYKRKGGDGPTVQTSH